MRLELTILQRLSNFKISGGSFTYLIVRVLTLNRVARQLLSPSQSRKISPSARRINNLINPDDKFYLEIGIHNGCTFEQIRVPIKHGVEPHPRFNLKLLPKNIRIFKMNSDDFFSKLPKNEYYNFIFIDGSHEFRQVGRDLINSLNHLSDNGKILMDDMVPSDSISAIPDWKISSKKRNQAGLSGNPNHGDCFKLLPFITRYLGFMQIFLIIYPNNPQLLLVAPPNLKQFFDKEFIKTAFEEYDFSNYTFENIFESDKLKKYPLFIEELLEKKLNSQK